MEKRPVRVHQLLTIHRDSCLPTLCPGLSRTVLSWAVPHQSCLWAHSPALLKQNKELHTVNHKENFKLGASSLQLRRSRLRSKTPWRASYPSSLSLTVRGGQVQGKCPAGYFCPLGTSEVMTPGSKQPPTHCHQRHLCAERCPQGNNHCLFPIDVKNSELTQLLSI